MPALRPGKALRGLVSDAPAVQRLQFDVRSRARLLPRLNLFQLRADALVVTAAYMAGFFLGVQQETLLYVLMAFCLLFPLWFFRYPRSLWMGFDELLDAREPNHSDASKIIDQAIRKATRSQQPCGRPAGATRPNGRPNRMRRDIGVSTSVVWVPCPCRVGMCVTLDSNTHAHAAWTWHPMPACRYFASRLVKRRSARAFLRADALAGAGRSSVADAWPTGAVACPLGFGRLRACRTSQYM